MHHYRFMLAFDPCELLVGFFKTLKLFIATLDGQVQSFFGLLFATPDAFEFLINDGADLNKVAQTHAT